jgi:hypothetical protein
MMKDTKEPGVKSGLSEHENLSKGSSPKKEGMDSHGPNQIPMGVKKASLSTDRGKFREC